MRITDLLAPEAIELGVSVASKPDAIEKLISLHEGAGNLNDVQAYREAILAREAGGTTAIGEGMAIPHAKTDAVAKPALAAITVPEGVDYEFVMNDFVTYVDGRAEFFEGLLDDMDGAVDSGAETARCGKDNLFHYVFPSWNSGRPRRNSRSCR